jgi:hypothetical protein
MNIIKNNEKMFWQQVNVYMEIKLEKQSDWNFTQMLKGQVL